MTLKDLKFLCTQNPANGMSDCTLSVFAAKVDSENSIQDVDEVAYKQWMPIAQVKELLRNNETKEGVSIWQSFLHYSFMSIDLALRACFILIGEKICKGETMNRKDILGNEIKSECVGCAIVRGEVKLPAGIIYDGESIILAADPEIPIPGFLIITSKRHIQSLAELTSGERTEIGNTIAIAERAIKDLKIAETVTLVQEERSKHFHIWIFPNQEWMLEKFGYGLQYLRDINAFAKDNASDADIENVIRTAEEIKKYIESEDKYD